MKCTDRLTTRLYSWRLFSILGCGLLLIILVTACTASESRLLSYETLTGDIDPKSPLDDSAFAMPAGADAPEHVFEGRLELLGEDSHGHLEVLSGDLGQEPAAAHLPEFDFEFVQSGTYLIPVQRGLIITGHPNWNYFLEPGRVWQEATDQGYSRGSFPFALIWKGSNATFNGVMSFLFNQEGISRVWYQVTQETCLSLRANLWGLLQANYHHERVPTAKEIRASFERELANKIPTRPIEQLAQDYPGVDISSFGRGVSPQHLTWYGLVVDGVNYVSGCTTRFGTYAYCEYLRAPSYSTAKSMFASLALMRLAQKYDPEVGQLLVIDYLPETGSSPGDWRAVTFDHTLDMATGNFRTSDYMVDEEHFDTDPFWLREDYAGKIAAALSWPNGAPPGTTWVYHTSDTFVVTRAMHNYLQTQAGEDADIYRFIVDEVYKPIQVGPGAHTTLRTREDNWQGQPYGGYGLWWIPDDIAKITKLLQSGGKTSTGEQLLHPAYLAAAMQQDPNDHGVNINSRSKYNNGFWATKYTPSDGYDCSFWVPHMLGISGNVVVLLPNGTTYYYFSDNREFTWDAAVRESNKIRPYCQK